MKIAIIGGGTAGFMAAAHISHQFPQFELFHIYDSNIPNIGVGEGTQANFPAWLQSITGLEFEEIQQRCNATRKYAIKFENWGTKNPSFLHNFYPAKQAYGYHISASKMSEVLAEYINATRIDKRIVNIHSDGVKVDIQFSDNTNLEVDFAFDGRGFPKEFNDNDQNEKINMIPNNSALIRRGPVVDYNVATRSIARPHGWIFVIPLTTHTSYGYIYNSDINSLSEIDADFQEFCQSENIKIMGEDKKLTFPNFICKDFFDGALFKIGNKAAFIEPLEATALGLIHGEITYACLYPLQELANTNGGGRGSFDPDKIRAFNQFLYNTVLKVCLFVGWHYAGGSPFKTDFWQFAKSNFEEHWQKLDNQYVKGEFTRFLKAGSNFNYWEHLGFSRLDYAGISPASFYEIGNGIGYFSNEASFKQKQKVGV